MVKINHPAFRGARAPLKSSSQQPNDNEQTESIISDIRQSKTSKITKKASWPVLECLALNDTWNNAEVLQSYQDKTQRKTPARRRAIAVVVGRKTAEYFEEMVVEHSASMNTAASINPPANVNLLASINTTTSSSLRLKRKVVVADIDTLDVVELDRQPTEKVVVYEIAEDNDGHLQTMLQKPEPKEAIKSKPKQ
ncbi:hypothetical protein PS15m_010430 [Mucor circinelloides]